MIKGVLLDIDGTLVLSNEAHTRSWRDAFQNEGYDIPLEKIRPLIGMGGEGIVNKLIPDIDQKTIQSIQDFRKDIFHNVYVPKLKAAPGSRELVSALKNKGVKIIAASSSKKENITALLKAAHVDDLITEYTTGSDVKNAKPAPDIILSALKKIRLQPQQTILIGDTPYDISAARKAGVKVIAVRTGGFTDNELKGAAAIYDDAADILTNIKDIL